MGSRTTLAVLLLAVVGVAGCGGSSHQTVNPEKMLDSAAAHPVASADVNLDLRLEVRGVQELSGPLQARFSGPYVSGGGHTIPKLNWRMSASALGFPVGGHLLSTGTNAFLTVYGDTYEVGTDAVAAANARIAEAMAIHPRSWFGRARVNGQGNEGGTDCERISAPLRGDAMARDLAPVTEVLGMSEAPSVTGRTTACVGFDDRVLHQLQVGAVLDVPPADQPALHGASSIALALQLVLSDVGKPQPIPAPPRGGVRPIRDLGLTLNDLGVPIPLG
jgi:hypothetical protein